MSGNVIPNDDIIRMAEKEEPRFLNILLRDKETLAASISFGVKPSENGKPGHFLHPRNNFLYSLMHKNFLKYNSILTRSAMDSLVDVQSSLTEEEKAASKGYWDKVWNRHDVAPEDYLLLRKNLNDRYILWQFFEKWRNGDKILHATTNHADLVREFINGFNSISNLSPDQYSLTMGIDEGIKNAMTYVDNRRQHPEQLDTLISGIKTIDDIYHGFPKGSYTLVSGLINGGKTTLLMNIGFNMAKMGKNVAYVSLEKDANLFFRRTLALHALTDYNRIKVGGTAQNGLSDYWYGKLKEAAKDLKETIKPLYHCLQFVQDTPLTKILSDVDKLRGAKKLDVLIVDYLQVIGVETRTVGRPDLDLHNIHKRLMAYGREHGIVVFTALQLKSSSSREIRKKADKVVNDTQLDTVSVNTEDYAGSQNIIADADNAMGVVLNGDHPPTKMFISFSKSRDDESRRTVALDFDGRLGRVSDQQYGEAQIKAVSAVSSVIYDEKITEEELEKGDSLFDKFEEKAKDAIKEVVEVREVKKEVKPNSEVDALFTTTTTTMETEVPAEEDFDANFDDMPIK